jgi:hypothetical protein
VNREPPPQDQGRVDLSVDEAADYVLRECHMVLPGMQTLFAFQLIVVFHPGFSQKLGPFDQRVHLFAVGLVTVAVALIMTPAAYHRQTGPRRVTQSFVTLASRLVLWSMCALATALSLDFYLISKVILGNRAAVPLAAGVFAFLVFCWFILPRTARLRRALTGNVDDHRHPPHPQSQPRPSSPGA